MSIFDVHWEVRKVSVASGSGSSCKEGLLHAAKRGAKLFLKTQHLKCYLSKTNAYKEDPH